MATVYYRPAARRDLIEHFVYLAVNADEATADRFIASAETSFAALAEQPQMGSPLTPRNQQLVGLRKWRVSGFDNFLIFYLPRKTAFRLCVYFARHAIGGNYWASGPDRKAGGPEAIQHRAAQRKKSSRCLFLRRFRAAQDIKAHENSLGAYSSHDGQLIR